MRKAACKGCGAVTWVNVITRGGRKAGEYCAACFETVWHDEPGRPARTNAGSGPGHNDPGFDDVIRAMEEDRD